MSRLQRQALRALIAALLLWAAPARPVSAAPLREVPVWVVAVRALAPAPEPVVSVRASAAPVAPKRVASRSLEPALSTPPPYTPAYLLHCALLR